MSTGFSKDSLTNSFCPALWLHTHISPQSERRMCCVSTEPANWQRKSTNAENSATNTEYKPLSFEEHWNSEKMRSVRLRMLAGETLPECSNCNSDLNNINPYRKHFAETMFSDRTDEILNNTDSSGFTTLKPVSYDYRVSNLCNFKCRMCSEQSSSSFEIEKRKHGLVGKREIWLLPENRPKITEFQETVVEDEFWKAAKSGRIEEIYWAGGEPTMLQIHWELMDYLVKSGQSKNIEVRYNTNLSRVKYKGYDLVEMLKHFEKVVVQASMDGTGDIAEFIRTGLIWDEWIKNLNDISELKSIFGQDSVVLDVTLTLPGLFAMKDLMKFADENHLTCYIKLCHSPNSFFVLSPYVLPYDLLKDVLLDLLEFEKSLGSEFTEPFRSTFEGMLDKEKVFENRFSNQKDLLITGRKYQAKLEEIRPNTKLSMEDILSANTKVLEWWRGLID